MCRRVQGSEIFKQNSIILICSRFIVYLPIWLSLALGGRAGGKGVSRVTNYSLYEFRSKESSNRIKISWLVQDLLNFGLWAPCSSGEGAGGWGVSGGIWRQGDVPTHVHMHVNACTCTHAHVYMYRNCKWPPTLRHWCLSCLSYMWVCGCVHGCMCIVHEVPPHTHTHTQSNPPTHHSPKGGPLESIKIQ